MATAPPTVPDHGTRARYGRGCRCRRCTESNTRYQRGYRMGQRLHSYQARTVTVRGVTWQVIPLPFDGPQ